MPSGNSIARMKLTTGNAVGAGTFHAIEMEEALFLGLHAHSGVGGGNASRNQQTNK